MENDKLCYRAIKDPVNRHDKRILLSEVAHVDKYLSAVEKNFLEQLLGENAWEYSEMYKYYLRNFQAAVQYAEKTVKPTHITINHDYFHALYCGEAKAQPLWKIILENVKKLYNAITNRKN